MLITKKKMKYKKLFLMMWALIILSCLAIAFTHNTAYNPFTNQLDYVIDTNQTGYNLTIDYVILSTDPTNHYIYDNGTCVIIEGDTSTLNIC